VCVVIGSLGVASRERVHSAREQGRSVEIEHACAGVRTFRVQQGAVELRGSLLALDAHVADADVVLDVRNPARRMQAQYRYRLRVVLASGDPLELCVHERHMYALIPRQGRSWRSLIESGDLERGIEVVRLDGAGEEG
jgi:hypothetical protein